MRMNDQIIDFNKNFVAQKGYENRAKFVSLCWGVTKFDKVKIL